MIDIKYITQSLKQKKD